MPNKENEDVDLDEYMDGEYTAPVFFSDPIQGELQSKFLPYSMSSFISVSSVNCTTCGPTYYDHTKSNVADFPDQTPENLVNRTLGPRYYEEGYFGTDTVCLPRSSEADLCAENVDLFEVTVFGGYPEQIDGLFGLAPVDEKTGPSYVMQLYNAGSIPSPQATVWYNPKGIQSTLTFGGIPDGAISGVQYNSHRMTKVYDDWFQDEMWMLKLDDIAYSGYSIKGASVTHALINTKSPFIWLDKQDWDAFTDKV